MVEKNGSTFSHPSEDFACGSDRAYRCAGKSMGLPLRGTGSMARLLPVYRMAEMQIQRIKI
jgi:hypothetical protein